MDWPVKNLCNRAGGCGAIQGIGSTAPGREFLVMLAIAHHAVDWKSAWPAAFLNELTERRHYEW